MAEKLVPLSAFIYIVSGIIVLFINRHMLPDVFRLILSNAFSVQAGVGGFVGYSVRQAMRYGISRGLYSNEAGEGSAAMIHAPAITDHPARQGTLGILEVFIDTLVVCSITAFTILTSGLDLQAIPSNTITMIAFETAIPIFKYLVGISMILLHSPLYLFNGTSGHWDSIL